ncbi:23S rRNA (adenine(2503)-C(2))-methyltransferase RlmN [Candidatus Peregrinibacteria bacterium]|nr:23S rRNA (adenine(2503)-C(2))-methyltransferase RlmN [Candidatus Peregrinibacteria bacterium]
MKSLFELRELFKKRGIPQFRANQIYQALFKSAKNNYADIHVLPKDLTEFLEKEAPIYTLKPLIKNQNKDGTTIKALFELRDGEKIEAVLMKFEDKRNSVCVSCQAGCPMKCVFCATGKMGFRRNLTYEEIVDQALYFEQELLTKGERVNHIVFMGMGEPFLNYDEVIKAAKMFNDPAGFNISFRHITVSTSGIIPGIKQMINDIPQANLAVSLHAPNDKLRKKLMPVAKTYLMNELMETCKEYTHKTHRRITYEYVMLKDINDSDKCAHELSSLLRGQLCHVNLIPFNETYSKGIKASVKNRIDSFAHILKINGIPATIRVSMGKEINAACGQLAGKNKSK